ncbi:MAG TPA: ATP-binding protein [Mycobacteriales bacterium]|nr:ATP-binding protein [Mycobacteriales bacterium]
MRSRAVALRGAAGRLDRDWRDLPLRTRLTTAAALSATLAIIAVIGVAYIAVRHELRGQIDQQLRRQIHELHVDSSFNPFNGTGSFTLNPGAGEIGGYAAVLTTNGQRANGSDLLPMSRRDLRIARNGKGTLLRDTHFQGRHVRMITAALTLVLNGQTVPVAVQIALPLGEVDEQLHTLAAAFVVLAVAGLALTVFASWGAVRRVIRPVQQLTETAEEIAATRDLTVRIASESNDELGRLATSFNTMLDALERSLAAQRQLVTDASHELRTPLASLRTNVEVLNDVDRLSPQQRTAVLDGIITQLDELTGLVADVVELARGESPPSDHDDVALDELVSRAVERARRHWPNLTFRLHTEPVLVRGVASRLDRAVANMLDNAGKFSPPNGTIELRLTADGAVTVSDEGPGVPDAALPHVFDRFFRADEARALPGSGLGLAIVQQIAEGHRGSISLSNRPGGGAVATLRLPPLAPPEPGAVDVEPPPTAEPAAGQSVPMPVEQSLFR